MNLIQEGRTTKDVSGGYKVDVTTATGVVASSIRQSTQSAISTLDKLRQFAGKGVELGTKEMVANAKKEAIIDVTEGSFSDYGLLEGNSVYDQAYNSAAETAYISKTNTDIQASANKMAIKNKYSPVGFLKAWDKHTGEISKNTKGVSRYVDAVTSDVASKYGNAAYTKIAGTLANKVFELNKKDNSSALVMYEEEFTTAKIRGDEEAAQTALINRNHTLRSMQQSFQISERGIEASNRLFEKSVTSAQVKSNFFNAMSQGSGARFIVGFKKMAKDDKNFDKFSDTEIHQFVQDMHKDIKEENSYQDNLEKQGDAKKEALHDDAVNTFDNAWLSGDLTQGHVDLALKQGVMSQTEYKFYSNKVHDTGATFTNTQSELNVVVNMASLEVKDIMELTDMTNADKMKYIKQLSTYKSSEGGKWTSTVQGRASLEMLKTKYNIVGADMMSKYTKESDIAAYGQLYRSFILEMEKLAPELREGYAMHYAQAAIDLQEISIIENKKTNIKPGDEANYEERKQAKKEKIIQRAQAYQKIIGEKKTEIYIQGLAVFMDDYGVTDIVDFGIKEIR